MAKEMSAMDKRKQEKLRAIKGAFRQLEKTTKKEGIVFVLGDREHVAIESISTGSLTFDIALGVGGFPKGRIIELYGAESSGKTLCATKCAAECQKEGGIVAIVDMEHAFDPSFARKLGLNTDEVILSQPDHMQDAFNVIDALVDSGGCDLIILDSVAALVPREELEGEVGKQTIGLIARYMSQFLRRITPKAHSQNCTIIFINQTRDAVGVMYGDPVTTPGGKALKFYSSVRCQVAKIGGSNITVKKGGEDQIVGHGIRVTVKKNKVAAPFRKAEFTLYYDGRKVDKCDELAQVALIKGLIPKYDAAGNLSPTGRNYKWLSEPNFSAKKKDDVAAEIKKYPKVQEELLNILKNGIDDDTTQFDSQDLDGDLSDEDFEIMAMEDAKNIKNGVVSDAEEVESSWEDI
jgi:recombination protein RecA